MAVVTISGGTGLIGKALAKRLREKDYDVKILTRNPSAVSEYEAVYWNPAKMEIDSDKIADSDFIVNLAGENIFGKRWTKSQKEKILSSRINSTRLLANLILEEKITPQAFISTSAIGYYGSEITRNLFTENDKPGNDFLANVCVAWEAEAKKVEPKTRTVIFRTGVVFSKEGGAFPKLTFTLNFSFINSIGSGEQFLSWIHIEDIVNIFLFAIENRNISGVFNAVAPESVTFNYFVNEIRKMRNVFQLPNVPSFLIKLFLGEAANSILGGSAISSQKIIKEGFRFRYPALESALENLFRL